MTRLQEITRELFGDDADRLLDAHAVVPLNHPVNMKAPVKGWRGGFDPAREVQFHSLALVTGVRSGITVWDFDDLDRWTPPATANVKTTKGMHIYTAREGIPKSASKIDKFDLLDEGRCAIFFGPGKTFIKPDLTPVDVMNHWFDSAASSCRDQEQGYETGLQSRVKEQGYCEFLSEKGYTLDKKAVRDQYVKTMSTVPEGSRNLSLYRYTREMVRCGLDLEDLAKAAIDSGLDPEEIDATMQSAEAAVLLDPGKSVYDRVTFWLDNTLHVVPPIAHDVMREVATRAIEVNDLAPFFPQQDIADRMAEHGHHRDRSTISKILTLLDRAWGVIKVIPLGYQPDGRKNPNAYRLCIDGQPISEIDR